jgi:hypothetical protein
MRGNLLGIVLFMSACGRPAPPPPCTPASTPPTSVTLATASGAAGDHPPAVASRDAPLAPPRRANPADVASIDSIIAALYGSVSGPPGPRDWDRVRSLFAPGALVAPVEHLPGGAIVARIVSIEAFIERSSRSVPREGFYEKEIARRTDAFGSIVHVFSTYEHRHNPDDPRPFRRGINSIQLLKDRDRYWVVSVYWDSEREGTPLPVEYLPAR